MSVVVAGENRAPMPYATLAVTSTAAGMAASVYQPVSGSRLQAVYATVYNPGPSGSVINYTVDGTTPTNTVGFPLYPDDILVLENITEITKFQAILKTGESNTTLRIQPYR